MNLNSQNMFVARRAPTQPSATPQNGYHAPTGYNNPENFTLPDAPPSYSEATRTPAQHSGNPQHKYFTDRTSSYKHIADPKGEDVTPLRPDEEVAASGSRKSSKWGPEAKVGLIGVATVITAGIAGGIALHETTKNSKPKIND